MKNWMIYSLIFVLGIFLGLLYPGENQQSKAIYATYLGGKLTNTEVLKTKGSSLLDAEKSLYYMKKNSVDEILKKRFLGAEGDYLNIEEIQVSAEEFNQVIEKAGYKAKTISPKDYQNLYDNHRLKKAKDLQNQKYSTQAEKLKMVYTFPLPNFPEVEFKSKSNAQLGAKSSKIAVGFFLNYMSPHLKSSLLKMEQLNQTFPGQLSFNLHFKGSDSENTVAFASFEAALCSNNQDKLIEFHKALYERPPENSDQIQEIAKKLELDMKKFDPCFAGRKFKETVLNDQKVLEDFQNYSEPVFVINKKLISSLEDFEILKDLIQREL